MVDLDFTYKFIGERLCLDFCNTGESRVDGYVGELLGDYHRLLNWSKQARLLNDREVQSLRQLSYERPGEAAQTYDAAIALREVLYRLFSAVAASHAPDPNDLARLNEMLDKAMLHRHLEYVNSDFEWVWDRQDNDLGRMLWPVTYSAADLLVSAERNRVQECGNGNCSWLFLDVSRNHSRRWCTMEGCGNRVKARRFRKQGSVTGGE